ncbi:MAG: 5-carboxymethyl-2-hydroxymuconate isomerase [Acidobacteria bacterium]|nr:MAG: 5-carboxymethyl-2-hydroxymuconate isomerase [Acidobacteriota bacterium]
MKIIRYEDRSGKIHYAVQRQGAESLRINGDPLQGFEVTSERAVAGKILAPVVPPMIWCIGKNYRQHADEVGMGIEKYPEVFAKGANAVQDPDQPIRIPEKAKSSEIDYEGELVVVIGKPCKDVSREQALDYVAGYTCGNDVSARDWQLRRGATQWCRGKSFDTFAPLGPCLVTKDSLPDPCGLQIQTLVNGRVLQDANTRDMIHDVPALIEFLSQSTTLLPGTVIFTGTPAGVGMAQNPPLWLKEGDEVSVTIERIGTLTNRVCAAMD